MEFVPSAMHRRISEIIVSLSGETFNHLSVIVGTTFLGYVLFSSGINPSSSSSSSPSFTSPSSPSWCSFFYFAAACYSSVFFLGSLSLTWCRILKSFSVWSPNGLGMNSFTGSITTYSSGIGSKFGAISTKNNGSLFKFWFPFRLIYW